MTPRRPDKASRNGPLLAAVLYSLTVPAVSGPVAAADAAYGEYLSSECTTCHRSDGKDKGIPSIVGWPPEQFIAVLKSYKVKDRQNRIMQTITGRLTDEDMAALAAYYATLKPAP